LNLEKLAVKRELRFDVSYRETFTLEKEAEEDCLISFSEPFQRAIGILKQIPEH